MEGTTYGIPSRFFLNAQQRYRKTQGLNQLDRYVLLKSTCKSLLNMVPVDF